MILVVAVVAPRKRGIFFAPAVEPARAGQAPRHGKILPT